MSLHQLIDAQISTTEAYRVAHLFADVDALLPALDTLDPTCYQATVLGTTRYWRFASDASEIKVTDWGRVIVTDWLGQSKVLINGQPPVAHNTASRAEALSAPILAIGEMVQAAADMQAQVDNASVPLTRQTLRKRPPSEAEMTARIDRISHALKTLSDQAFDVNQLEPHFINLHRTQQGNDHVFQIQDCYGKAVGQVRHAAAGKYDIVADNVPGGKQSVYTDRPYRTLGDFIQHMEVAGLPLILADHILAP